jgi:hypothetical protein
VTDGESLCASAGSNETRDLRSLATTVSERIAGARDLKETMSVAAGQNLTRVSLHFFSSAEMRSNLAHTNGVGLMHQMSQC